MQKNMEQILERGVKLDDLMTKSHDLSASSVQFYKQAKKTNQVSLHFLCYARFMCD